MNAHYNVKRPSYQNVDARAVLAAAQLRVAAWVDFRVARWLEQCAANIEAGQRLFETDWKPEREVGMRRQPRRSSPRSDGGDDAGCPGLRDSIKV
jgi:hypothetical protein